MRKIPSAQPVDRLPIHHAQPPARRERVLIPPRRAPLPIKKIPSATAPERE
jgi:hypothetical protein